MSPKSTSYSTYNSACSSLRLPGLLESDADPRRACEPTGCASERLTLESFERRATSDVIRRCGADHNDSPPGVRLPLGGSVGPPLELEIHRPATDSDATDRELREPGRKSRADDGKQVERRERIQPEHDLDHLDERTRRPRLRTVGRRVWDRSRDLAPTVSRQCFREAVVLTRRCGIEDRLDQTVDVLVEPVTLEAKRERRLLDGPHRPQGIREGVVRHMPGRERRDPPTVEQVRREKPVGDETRAVARNDS